MSRAIRGHLLVESALTSILNLNFVEVDDGEKDNDYDDDDDNDDYARDDGKQFFNDHIVAEQEESDI